MEKVVNLAYIVYMLKAKCDTPCDTGTYMYRIRVQCDNWLVHDKELQNVYAALYNNWPQSARQRNAIRMAFPWWVDSDPILYAGWV